MSGGVFGTIGADWQAWRTAFAGLKENPLAASLRLMRERRLGRLPWIRRNLILVVGIAIASMSVIWTIIMLSVMPGYPGYPGGSSSHQASVIQAIAGLFGSFTIVAYFWFIQVLFFSLYSALAFLGLPGKRDACERIDDLIGLSALSDREFGAVAISQSLFPIVRPLITVVLIGQVSGFIQSALIDIISIGSQAPGFSPFGAEERYIPSGWLDEIGVALMNLPAWQLDLMLMPLDIIWTLAASLLGAVLIICLLIILGRSRPHGTVIPATVVIVMFWILVAGSATAFGSGMFAFGRQLSMLDAFPLMLIGTLVVPGLCLILLRKTLVGPASTAAVIMIIFLLFASLILKSSVLAFSLMPLAMGASSGLLSGDLGISYWQVFVDSIAWGSVVFSPSSPVAVVSDHNWRMMGMITQFPWIEVLRAPILVLVQLGTLAAISPTVRKAIALRRQPEQ